MARCSEQGLPWGLLDKEMPLKRCTFVFQMKFEGRGRLRSQGGEMKLDPDLHPEKKSIPLGRQMVRFYANQCAE